MNKLRRSPFWTNFGNRYSFLSISNFLYSHEKFQFIYLNKITKSMAQLLFILDKFEFKEDLVWMLEHYSINNILWDNASIITNKLQIEKLFKKKEELLITTNLIAKFLNQIYLNGEKNLVKNFENLDLSNCELKQKGTYYLILFLSYNNSFKSLNLTNTLLDLRALKFLSKIKNSKPWETLIFDNSIIFDINTCEYIIQIFPFTPNLKSISFKKCNLDKNSIKLLIDGLNCAKQLEHIYLDNNNILNNGIKYVLSNLSNFPNLLTLSARTCSFDINEKFWRSLNLFFSLSKSINELDLSGNSISSFKFDLSDCKYFAFTSLKRLKLNSKLNGLTAIEILKLFINSKLSCIEFTSEVISRVFSDYLKDYFYKLNYTLTEIHITHHIYRGLYAYRRPITDLLRDYFSAKELERFKYTTLEIS
jgi:hypothetical protein